MSRSTDKTSPANGRAADVASRSAQVVAHNLRRLMADAGMSYDEVVSASGLDVRTVRGVARGNQTPHAKSLRKLAEGLGVTPEELFAAPSGLSPEAFDAVTNPAVSAIQESHPDLFEGWSQSDFAELASRFGVGGQLTEQGALDQVNRINQNRSVLQKARVVLWSDNADMLTRLIELLYEQSEVKR